MLTVEAAKRPFVPQVRGLLSYYFCSAPSLSLSAGASDRGSRPTRASALVPEAVASWRFCLSTALSPRPRHGLGCSLPCVHQSAAASRGRLRRARVSLSRDRGAILSWCSGCAVPDPIPVSSQSRLFPVASLAGGMTRAPPPHPATTHTVGAAMDASVRAVQWWVAVLRGLDIFLPSVPQVLVLVQGLLEQKA